MKFLIIGDLHGQKPKIKFKDFDAIICPGDICSDKLLRPYINKWFKYCKKNEKISLDLFLEQNLTEKQEKILDKRSLKVGRKILKYLTYYKKPIFFVPGNWDQSYKESKIKNPDKNDYNYKKSFLDSYLGETNPELIKGLKNFYDCQYKGYELENFNILGYGLSSAPETLDLNKLKINKNQKEKLKKAYKKIENKLEKEYKKLNPNKPTIFLTHNVPYKILDKIQNKNSFADNKNFGSKIARKFCLKHKPIVCIGGHIHEYHDKAKLKETTVINAGFGKNVNTLLEIKNNKIINIEFKD